MLSLLIWSGLTIAAENKANNSPVKTELVLERQTVSPGETIKVGVKFVIDKPWHIYYKEPGDAGLPTRIRWSSNENLQFGELEWPEYEDFTQPGNVHGKGYKGEVTLWAPVTVAKDILPGTPTKVEARVDWLRCANICVQEKANLETEIEIAYQGARAEVATAPNFSLKDFNGEVFDLAAQKGKIVVLEWMNPACPFIQRAYREGLLTELHKRWTAQGVVWRTINSTYLSTSEENQEFAAKYDLPKATLDDREGRVGKLYAAKSTPHIFIIDQQGAIAYQGALDSDAYGDQGQDRVAYVDLALQALVTKSRAQIVSTKPYGCSIKYK